MAQLTATTVSPSILSERITALEYEREEKQRRHEAYRLAYEKLAEAGEAMRASVSPRLSASAGALMEAATGGKYKELGVDSSLSMTFRPETENGGRMTCEERFMSAGTADVAYISLRMALASLLTGGEGMPLILDESFSRLDDDRLINMLRLLAMGKRQCLLLTSCGREAACLQKAALAYHHHVL